jgi:hypothetical protein
MEQHFKYRPWPLGAWEEWKYKALCVLLAAPAAAYAGYRAAEYFITPPTSATETARQVYLIQWSGVAAVAGLIALIALTILLMFLGSFYTRRAARGNLPRPYWKQVPEAPLDPQWTSLLAACPNDLVLKCQSFHQLRLACAHPQILQMGIPDTFWADNEPPQFVLHTWQRVAGLAERLPKPIDANTGQLLRRAANYVPPAWLESCQTPQDLADRCARAEKALRKRGIDPKTITRPNDSPTFDDMTIAADLIPDSFYRPPGINNPQPWPEAHLGWCWPRIRPAALHLPPPLTDDDGVLLRRCAHLVPLPWLEHCRTREDLQQSIELALVALKDLEIDPDRVPESSQQQAYCDKIELLGHVYQTYIRPPELLNAAIAQARQLNAREALAYVRRGQNVPQLHELAQTMPADPT